MIKKKDESLIRQLTVVGIWVLAVNGLIGAGIFGLPAEVARLTGAYSPLIFAGCGILMLAVVLCFAEVSSYFKNTGGPILYTKTAFGPFIGFQTGWTLYVARLTAFAANINLLVSTVGYFWVDANSGSVRILLLFSICALLAWVNIVGAKQAMRSVGILTLLKFLPLLILVGVGLSYLEFDQILLISAELPGYSEFGIAALISIYAFVGWEGALIPAGEAKNPSRDMPRAMFWALGSVTLLYVAIQYVSMAALPTLASSTRPLVEVANVIMGPTGAIILTIGVVVSVGGNVASNIFTTPRVTYAISREGNLPPWFGEVHKSYLTPANSILFFAVVVFALAAYGSFVWLAAISALTRILIYMLCIGAIPKLRRTMPVTPDTYKLPGGYIIPVGALVICTWLLSSISLNSVLFTLVFLGIGSGLYFLMKRYQ
jgi:amino acid transporter